MFGFILNIPYTIIGLLLSLVSVPTHIRFMKKPYAFVVKVKSFWWQFYTVGRIVRAATIGHVILLGPKLEDKDLEHEIIHVQQYERFPILMPILYNIESIRKGYRQNKYEEEAYRLAGNIYKGK